MLSNPNSATSKSPDRDHDDTQFDRTQAQVGDLSMSNSVPKFLRLKNLEERGSAKRTKRCGTCKFITAFR